MNLRRMTLFLSRNNDKFLRGALWEADLEPLPSLQERTGVLGGVEGELTQRGVGLGQVHHQVVLELKIDFGSGPAALGQAESRPCHRARRGNELSLVL